MDSSSRTPRSPSPASEPPSERYLICPPPSPSMAAAKAPETLCNDNNIEDSGGSQGKQTSQNPIFRETVLNKDKKFRQRKSETSWTTTTTYDKDPAADGYVWRKYGEKMTLESKFLRSYYRCIYMIIEGCRAKKHIQMISDDPPCYRTVYKGKHTCKDLHNTLHHSFPPNRKSADSSIVEDSTADNPTRLKTLPSLLSSSIPSYPSYSMECNSTYDSEPSLLPKDVESKDGIMAETNDYYSMFFLLAKDYEFEEDTIIQLWMARECILDEQIGHIFFSSLYDGGYMIHSGTDYVTKNNRYKLNSKKMKTLLDGQDHNRNSYLKWENGFNNSDVMTNPSEIQHVSLFSDHIDATVFETLEQLNELKTLLFLANYGIKVVQIPEVLFQSLKKLEILDLSGTHIKKLSSSVGCMILLRYLDLSRTLIEWLPDTICSLVELQTLKLRGCSKLRGLPRQLKRLTNLRHLDVDVLRQLTTLPRGIGSLVNLRTLSGFLVGEEEGCKIQELKELNSITGDFCIAMLENIGNHDEAKEAEFSMKQHVKKLQLRWTGSQLSNNCYEVLECLKPSWNLKELQIFCYGGDTFPSWVGDPTFSELVSVTLFECEHVTELPLVEQLPWLKHLELVKMDGIKKIERLGESEHPSFFRLEKLEINGMQSLETWRWVRTNEGDYKNLVELTINDCPELRDFCVLSCLNSIKHLEIRECSKLESISEIKLPDSLEDLIVEDCPGIKNKCLQQGGEDWYKIQHVSNIRICPDDEDT